MQKILGFPTSCCKKLGRVCQIFFRNFFPSRFLYVTITLTTRSVIICSTVLKLPTCWHKFCFGTHAANRVLAKVVMEHTHVMTSRTNAYHDIGIKKSYFGQKLGRGVTKGTQVFFGLTWYPTPYLKQSVYDVFFVRYGEKNTHDVIN